jgi:hypothetical protein
MNKMFLIVLFQLINFIPCIVNAQESGINPGTSIRYENFIFDYQNHLGKEAKIKLDSIISDYKNLYSDGYYKTIELKISYLNDDESIFLNSTIFVNDILKYIVSNGIPFDKITIKYYPTDPNPYIRQPDSRIFFFYGDWNEEYPEGTEPDWSCDFDEKDIKTQTQLERFRKRCNKN